MKINVVAHTNSKNIRIEKDELDTYHVFVSKPPQEGKANAAVIIALSEFFKVNKNTIILVSGEKSKNKIFEIIIA